MKFDSLPSACVHAVLFLAFADSLGNAFVIPASSSQTSHISRGTGSGARSTQQTSRTCTATRTRTALCAKKKTNRKKVSSGGGFGSSSSSSSSSSSIDKSKVRSVSGYTGSGTKPLAKAANTFDAIRKVYGKEGTSDLYIRSPLNDEEVFWYVGKIVRKLKQSGEMNDEFDKNDGEQIELEGSSLPTEMEAVISQKRLILEYAKNQLRPQNFGGPYAQSLELWIAPGDTEMQCVQNKVSLDKVTGSTKDLSDGFCVNDVGFNPEIYIGDEKNDGGLRIKRDNNGDPIKEVFEINA